MNLQAPIFVAGSDTLIGSAIIRQLRDRRYTQVVGTGADAPDLADSAAVGAFFARTKPVYVFVAAGKSGGISANQKYPADLMLNNLQVAANVIASAHRHGTAKLLYLASSCIYPKQCSQPMNIASLMTGPMEFTSEPYAMAKMAGITLCRAYRQQYGDCFISAIPADVFGPSARFDAEDSHVVPALMVKMHQAKIRGAGSVELWGTGSPRREFTFVDDLADACLLLMRDYDDASPINIGAGEAISIREIAERIREVVGYGGELRFDPTKPDGAPIKLLDTMPLRRMGWKPSTPLQAALQETYNFWRKATETTP